MNQQEPTGTNRKVSELLYKKHQSFKALSFFIKSFSLADFGAILCSPMVVTMGTILVISL